jgi:hypothetical protein
VPVHWKPGPYIQRLVRARTPALVQAGPLKGMRYVQQPFCSTQIPKWLRICERGLDPFVEIAATLRLRTAIDIGAGEGHHAVGMSLRLSGEHVIAYENEVGMYGSS